MIGILRRAALKRSRLCETRKLDRPGLAHLAAGALVPASVVREEARETVERFRDACAAEKGHLPLAPEGAAAIEAHMTAIHLFHAR